MSEEHEQLPPAPHESQEPSREHSEALLQSAIERLKARGDSTRRFGCMSLPAPVFNDLCARLLDRRFTVKATAEWLAGQVEDVPSRNGVERFSKALFEEYRAAQFMETRRQAESYVKEAAAGDPDAMQMALNTRLTELLTDELLSVTDGGMIDTKRLMAIMMGARTVAQTAFDKQKMDARIKALEQQILDRDANIRLKDQKLQQLPAKIKVLQDKLGQVETAQAQGKKIDPRIYAAMRAQLVEMARMSAPQTTTAAPEATPTKAEVPA